MNNIVITESRGGSYRLTESDKALLEGVASNGVIALNDYIAIMTIILNRKVGVISE